MFPINLHVGNIIIPSHFIFDVLSFYVAFRYYLYLNQHYRDPLTEGNRWKVVLGTMAGALLGSRIVAALERPELFFHPSTLLFYFENKTIAGAVIGAIAGTEILKKIIGEKKYSGDIFVFPLVVGIMIGRIGCFLTGVSDGTVGLASNLPWAFDQGDGISRHPTALYEILFVGILGIILYQVQNKNKLKDGILFRLFVISYLGFRFLVEFIKPIQPIAAGLSAIQITSLAIASYYVVTLVTVFKYRPFSRNNL